MSEFSSGPIESTENLARFVFSPLHLTKKGEIKPSLFSHVFNKGCSIQRDSIATNGELGVFIENFLAKDTKFKWEGAVIGKSEDLKKLLIESSKTRALCLYDTAEKVNISHGEIHKASDMDEADEVELRHDLLKVFKSDLKFSPSSYRDGNLHTYIDENYHPQIVM